ncbi:kelch-like protein 24 isoform X1 [Mercenaria mercenaria]|uniref:kelch-like protein 24 isoform X1 n=1 Tax=Mercenaria mercenaria TaxID=6596 RepID=UPI001E1D3551|nr:kelch-like protein 24 isoform X1 [Mercenaria mercenaria]
MADDEASSEQSLASDSDDLEEDEEAECDAESMTSSAGALTPRLNHLSEGLEKLWITGAHSDIKITVENRVFNCHKAVLFATSPYFDAMFSSGMRESVSGEITFKEMEADTFELVMEYIYTGKEVVTQENVIKLLKASSLLQIKSLCEKCEAVLEPYIDLDNCIDIWRLSLIHSWEKVRVRAITKILKNFLQLYKTDAFMRLDAYELIQIIKDDALEVPAEEVVLDAVFAWARRGDPSLRKLKLGQILGNVRLGHISAERLAVLKSSPTSPVVDDQLAQQYIDDAIQYKLLPARRQEANSTVTHHRRCSQFDDVLVVMGGCMSMHPPYKRCNDVLAYSFAVEQWYKLESLPYDPGIEFATCTYGNDIFLTGGGSRTQTFLKYRSDKNKWKIGKPLCQGRRRHVMVALTNTLYVIGGYDHRLAEGNRMLASIEKYDMSEDGWDEVAQLPIPVSSFSSAVTGEKILLFGGEKNDKTDTGVVQCFDTRTNECTKITSLSIISKLTKAVTSGRRIFIIFFSGKIVEYNPFGTGQVCSLVGTVKSFRRIHYGAVQYRGNIFIVGGENEDTSLTREMIVFKTERGEAEKARVPLPNARLIDSCVKIALNKKFLVDEKNEGDGPPSTEDEAQDGNNNN